MPIMDGFEAARQISAMNHAQAAEAIPIVALTANAMEGDRQKCLDAGMNDYLSKPVRRADLKKSVYKWVRGIEWNEDAESAEPEPQKMPKSSSIDWHALNEARNLFKDKFYDMLMLYFHDTEEYCHEMAAAISAKSTEGIIRPAHTIKSTSARMGITGVSDIACLMEEEAKRAVQEQKPVNFAEFQSRLESMEALLNTARALIMREYKYCATEDKKRKRS